MTIFASKVHENSPNVKIGITYGPVSTYIEENVGHLRNFHTELGKLLDEMEAAAAEKAKTE